MIWKSRVLAIEKKAVARSGFFDAAWYFATYPDAAADGSEALDHFVRLGRAELRSPGPRFNARQYAEDYPDIGLFGHDPLMHYLNFGMHEGRRAKSHDGRHELIEFVPPRPMRPHRQLSHLTRIGLARENLISCFEEWAFKWEFRSFNVLGKHAFLCNSPESVQFAFSTHNASFESKTPEMRYALQPLLGDGLFVSDGATWRQRRRIIAPIVHMSRLPDYAPLMIEAALETRRRWAQLGEGATIDVLAEMGHLTAETICRTIFGQALGRESAVAIVAAFSRYQNVASYIDIASLLGVPDYIGRWHSQAVRREAQVIKDLVDGIINRVRSGAGGLETSMVRSLIDARDPETGAPLDDEAIRNEAVVLFMAGYETTASSLAWAWYLLSQAPDVEARLQAEIDNLIGAREPKLADVGNLVFTRAVFEETLRLYPPVPFLSRQASRDETFQGERIPKGSRLYIIPWLLHRHRHLWKKPDHFIPDRFLPGSPEPVSKFAYVPFSIGPRVCPGMSFGLTEAMLCIATLSQRFQLRLPKGHRVEAHCRLTLRPGEQLHMELQKRSPSLRRPGDAVIAPAALNVATCPFHHE